MSLAQLGPRFTEIMEDYHRLAFFGFLVEDEPRGWVRAGPGGRPRIFYNLGQADLAKLVRGVEILAEVFFAAGAHTVLLPIARLEELRARSEIARIRERRIRAWDIELTAFHPLGTCRIGATAEHGVLRPTLETWSTDRLFVADGSVFPSSLGVNPQMTIMAASSMAAEHVAARVGLSSRA